MWALKTQFLSNDHYSEAYALFTIHYENDSIVGTSQRVGSNRQYEIRLTCPAKFRDVPVRSVNGTVYLPLRKDGFGILALNNFVLVRYHDLTRKADLVETQVLIQSDSTLQIQNQKPTHIRQNPYDIRNDQNDERTIKIVRDKPLRNIRRR